MTDLSELRPSIAHVLVRRRNLSIVVPIQIDCTIGKLKRHLVLLLNYQLFPMIKVESIQLRYPEDIILDDSIFLVDLGLYKKDISTLFMLFTNLNREEEELNVYDPKPIQPDDCLIHNAMQRAQQERKRLGLMNPPDFAIF